MPHFLEQLGRSDEESEEPILEVRVGDDDGNSMKPQTDEPSPKKVAVN